MQNKLNRLEQREEKYKADNAVLKQQTKQLQAEIEEKDAHIKTLQEVQDGAAQRTVACLCGTALALSQIMNEEPPP